MLDQLGAIMSGQFNGLYLDDRWYDLFCGDNRCGGDDGRQTRDRGLHTRPSEAKILWSALLKSLVRRWLCGTKLAISDAHEGLEGGNPPCAGLHVATLSRALDAQCPGLRAEGPVKTGVGRLATGASSPTTRMPGRGFVNLSDQLRDKWAKLGAFTDESEAMCWRT